MKARFSYPLIFLSPGAVAAFVLNEILVGAGAGIFWIFVFGDNPWPPAAMIGLMVVAAMISMFALAWAMVALYVYGKGREKYGGLIWKHVLFAIGMSVCLPALVVLHRWGVGNFG